MLSFRMFQAVLQNNLEGPCTGKGGLDQELASAVEERVAVPLPGHVPEPLGGREFRVHMDILDIRHRVQGP